MNYYIYRVTHIDTGEFYIGSRQCECDPENDSYLGSFKTWQPDTLKLKKEVIEEGFLNRDHAIEREAELIYETINNDLNRNYHIPPDKFHTEGLVPVKDKMQNTFSVSKDNPKYLSGELVPQWTGRCHKENTRKKMSEAKIGVYDGQKNPQYGKVWIYHEETFESKRIGRNESIPKGWRRGRVMKKRSKFHRGVRPKFCISCGERIEGTYSKTYCSECNLGKRNKMTIRKYGIKGKSWKDANEKLNKFLKDKVWKELSESRPKEMGWVKRLSLKLDVSFTTARKFADLYCPDVKKWERKRPKKSS